MAGRAPGPTSGAYGIWIDRPRPVTHDPIADVEVRDVSDGFYEGNYVGFHSCARSVFGRSDERAMITLATHHETKQIRSLAGCLALWLALAASQAVAQTLPPGAGAERTIRQPEAPSRTLLPPGQAVVAEPQPVLPPQQTPQTTVVPGGLHWTEIGHASIFQHHHALTPPKQPGPDELGPAEGVYLPPQVTHGVITPPVRRPGDAGSEKKQQSALYCLLPTVRADGRSFGGMLEPPPG